jgi:hypothetical protein
MKKLKISLALAAVVLGIGAAAATHPARPFSIKYGYNQATSQWELVRTGYSCTESTADCTALFDTPPSQGGEPIQGTQVKGDFTNGN